MTQNDKDLKEQVMDILINYLPMNGVSKTRDRFTEMVEGERENFSNALHGFRAGVVISTVNGNPLKKSEDLMDYFDEYFASYLANSPTPQKESEDK